MRRQGVRFPPDPAACPDFSLLSVSIIWLPTACRRQAQGRMFSTGRRRDRGRRQAVFSLPHRWILRCAAPISGVLRSLVRFRQPGVDNALGGGLYTPHTVRRRLGAMARPRSSSLIFGDQPPIKSRRFGASTALRASGEGTRAVPGCLTSESEERETWTAGSLRTVASGGAIRSGRGRWKRLRRYTFQVNTYDHSRGASFVRGQKVGPRQTCDQPRSKSQSNLRV